MRLRLSISLPRTALVHGAALCSHESMIFASLSGSILPEPCSLASMSVRTHRWPERCYEHLRNCGLKRREVGKIAFGIGSHPLLVGKKDYRQMFGRITEHVSPGKSGVGERTGGQLRGMLPAQIILVFVQRQELVDDGGPYVFMTSV